MYERHPFRIPMSARFRGVDHREGVLLRGPAGWGEFSPFPEYPPAYASRWLAAATEAATRPWPAPVRDRIPVNVTVPAVDPREAHRLVAVSGCRTAKVKVAAPGDTAATDAERVAAVRDALGPGGKVRVDANGAWDVDTAVHRIRDLARFDLEYVEQPVATISGMAAVRRRVDVPIAADESIRRAEDPLRAAARGAADVVVLKVQPLGGVYAALEVAEACRLPVVVSSALETSVGLAAGVALAAALPELRHACGLATVTLLEGDVTDEPLVAVDGSMPVRRPEPEPDALERWRPETEVSARLSQRLAAAEAASGSSPYAVPGGGT